MPGRLAIRQSEQCSLITLPHLGGTIRSRVACKYSTGQRTSCRSPVASSWIISRIRRAIVLAGAVSTCFRTWSTNASSCPLPSIQCSTVDFDMGNCINHDQGRNFASSGVGGVTKEATKTIRDTICGNFAASFTTKGPENDSPINMHWRCDEIVPLKCSSNRSYRQPSLGSSWVVTLNWGGASC